MIIGLDFDNTIVRYDKVFHQVALEKRLIADDIAVSKIAVRNALRDQGNEDAWTEMQGYVYGQRMELAEIYEGAKEFIRAARDGNHRCVIISHKTRFPYMGPQYDLHAAAQVWIQDYFHDEKGTLIETGDIFFHETKKEKIDHIGALKCDVFFDDLPEILRAENFPEDTRPLLFDPDNHHADEDNLMRVRSWDDFRTMLHL